MYKIVRKSEAVVREIAPTYQARNYITKELSPDISLAVNVANSHVEVETTQYDRVYYVMSGRLDIQIAEDYVMAEVGDSVFISKGTQYEFSGTFEAVVVNQPAFGT